MSNVLPQSLYSTEHREWEQLKNIPPSIAAFVLERDSRQCQMCGTGGENRLQLHHWDVFRSHGGQHTPENLVTLCFNCHEDIHQGRADIKVVHFPDDTWGTFCKRRRL